MLKRRGDVSFCERYDDDMSIPPGLPLELFLPFCFCQPILRSSLGQNNPLLFSFLRELEILCDSWFLFPLLST